MKNNNTTDTKQLPNRPLASDFTAKTLKNTRRASQRYQRWHGLRTWFHPAKKQEKTLMKLLHKPLFASLAAVAVIGIGGTTYAAVTGGIGSITAIFGGSTKTPGSRVVKVAVQNCHDVNPFNVVKGTGDGNEDRYYQVKDSANMSDQQIVSLIQSVCRSTYNSPEAQQAADKASQAVTQQYATLESQGNKNGTITAISANSIDITVQPGPDETYRQPFTEHFTQINPNLPVLDGTGQVKNFSSLRVGDRVGSLIYNNGAPYNTETTPIQDINWSEQILGLVSKQSPDGAAYDKFTALIGTGKIEQVVPCTTNKTGYCTFEQANT